MGRKRVTACQQDWHTSRRTGRHRVRLQGMQPRSRESNTGRPHTLDAQRTICPHAVSEFPLQDEESTVTIDGHSYSDAAGCSKTVGGSFSARVPRSSAEVRMVSVHHILEDEVDGQKEEQGDQGEDEEGEVNGDVEANRETHNAHET